MKSVESDVAASDDGRVKRGGSDVVVWYSVIYVVW